MTMNRYCTALISALLWALSVSAVTVSDVTGVFHGSLNIAGDEYSGKEVYILPGVRGNSVTFVLPDFRYNAASLGDIVLPDIPIDSKGQLALNNATLYIKPISERATISVINGLEEGGVVYNSVIGASSAQILLTIAAPSLPEDIFVLFSGNKVTNRNYAITNGGFEGSWSNGEPEGWHSFNSATGSYVSFVKTTEQFQQSSEKRPGSAGSHSAMISSKIVAGAKANGNCTNGQINAGSMTAEDASGNYNFSDPSNNGYNTPFVGNPDSLVFWAKYVPADGDPQNEVNKARVHAVVTTAARYQDPESQNYSSVKIADAVLNYAATSNMGWQRLAVPFKYTSVNPASAAYMLITFSSNQTPGGGSSHTEGVITKTYYLDNVYLDDVEMVYNHALSSLTMNGKAVQFTGNAASVGQVFSDSEYDFVAKVNGKGAKSFVGYDPARACVYIYVVADNYAQARNYSVYTLQMAQPSNDTEYAYSASTCENEPYSDENFSNLSAGGTYSKTIPNTQGGDSLITLTLTVNSAYSFPVSASVLPGETYQWRGKDYRYTAEGVYTDAVRLHTVAGCDSVYTLELKVYAEDVVVNEELTACRYEELVWHGKTIPTAEAGQFTVYDSLKSVYGKDSVHVLALTVRPAYRQESVAYVSNENTDFYSWAGHADYDVQYPSGKVFENQNSVMLINEGEYLLTERHQMTNGCDSAIVLRLMVSPIPVSYSDYTTTFCEGEKFSYNGVEYTKPFNGEVRLSQPNIYGGDSIVRLVVNVLPSPEIHESLTITTGETGSWEGYDLSTFAIGERELKAYYYTALGCDSVMVLHLTVKPVELPTGGSEQQTEKAEVRKVLRNGRLYIIRRDNTVYDLLGRKKE